MDEFMEDENGNPRPVAWIHTRVREQFRSMQYARFAEWEDAEDEMPEDLRQEIWDVAMTVSTRFLNARKDRPTGSNPAGSMPAGSIPAPADPADASWQQQVMDEQVWAWIQSAVPDLDLPNADDMIDDLEAIGWNHLPWSYETRLEKPSEDEDHPDNDDGPGVYVQYPNARRDASVEYRLGDEVFAMEVIRADSVYRILQGWVDSRLSTDRMDRAIQAGKVQDMEDAADHYRETVMGGDQYPMPEKNPDFSAWYEKIMAR
jgi:hypothetical protein